MDAALGPFVADARTVAADQFDLQMVQVELLKVLELQLDRHVNTALKFGDLSVLCVGTLKTSLNYKLRIEMHLNMALPARSQLLEMVNLADSNQVGDSQ